MRNIDGHILTYVTDNDFFTDSFNITAIDGTTIASMYKHTEYNGRWQLLIHNTKNLMDDKLVLGLTLAKRSFVGDRYSLTDLLTDSCNKFFWVTSYFLLALLGLILLVLICMFAPAKICICFN